MASVSYFYGQGRVYLAPINVDGTRGAWRWVGDVSAFSAKFSVDKVSHKESYSGSVSQVRSFAIGKTGTVDMTWHQLDAANLSTLLQGTANTESAGTFTAQTLPPTLAVGDTVDLGHMGVSALVITDATGTLLVAGTDYTLDANFGTVTILNLTRYTLPLKAAGSYSASKSVGIFNAAPQSFALCYRGVNLAENSAPVEAVFYRTTLDPAQQLDMITSGTDVAGTQVTANLMLDTTQPANGPLGQYGYIKQMGA